MVFIGENLLEVTRRHLLEDPTRPYQKSRKNYKAPDIEGAAKYRFDTLHSDPQIGVIGTPCVQSVFC